MVNIIAQLPVSNNIAELPGLVHVPARSDTYDVSLSQWVYLIMNKITWFNVLRLSRYLHEHYLMPIRYFVMVMFIF